jgi:hypothetical protein
MCVSARKVTRKNSVELYHPPHDPTPRKDRLTRPLSSGWDVLIFRTKCPIRSIKVLLGGPKTPRQACRIGRNDLVEVSKVKLEAVRTRTGRCYPPYTKMLLSWRDLLAAAAARHHPKSQSVNPLGNAGDERVIADA